jgi:hypothetical protein
MEAVDSSETLGNIYKTVWHHIPEDSKLHSHHCENLRAHYTTVLAFDSKTNAIVCIYAKGKDS